MASNFVEGDLPKMLARFQHKYFKATANAFCVTKLTDEGGTDMGNKLYRHLRQ